MKTVQNILRSMDTRTGEATIIFIFVSVFNVGKLYLSINVYSIFGRARGANRESQRCSHF